MTKNRVTIIDHSQPEDEGGKSGTAFLILTGSFVVAAAILAIFGAFSGPDSTPQPQQLPTTTTTTAATATTNSAAELAVLEYEADVELIHDLWWEQTTSWAGGFDGGLQFWVDNNYPDMGCTVDDYMNSWFPEGPIEGLFMERIVNAPTIELDEGWLIPGGKLEGAPARGRVYVMTVKEIVTAPELNPEPPSIKRFHVTILDGRAHFFIGCPV